MSEKTPAPKPVENMWDDEAKYYSMMTLMEERGTNLQLDAMPLDPNDVVLDCGCGPGRTLIQASKRVAKVIGLDNSEGMLEECRKNCEAAGVTNAEFMVADWQDEASCENIPEVDVIIQARGGGGPSTLERLRKIARKYAIFVMWSEGAPSIPITRQRLFAGCYSREDAEKYEDLRPFRQMRPMPPQAYNDGKSDGHMFGRGGPYDDGDKLPMGGEPLFRKLDELGVEYTVKTVGEGWDKYYDTMEEAYEDLAQMSRHPECLNMERFKANVDSYTCKTEKGFLFHLPTCSDVTIIRTR